MLSVKVKVSNVFLYFFLFIFYFFWGGGGVFCKGIILLKNEYFSWIKIFGLSNLIFEFWIEILTYHINYFCCGFVGVWGECVIQSEWKENPGSASRGHSVPAGVQAPLQWSRHAQKTQKQYVPKNALHLCVIMEN